MFRGHIFVSCLALMVGCGNSLVNGASTEEGLSQHPTESEDGIIPPPTYGDEDAALLFTENFEDEDYKHGFRGPVQWQAVARTTHQPRSGSFALRGNFLTDRNDPIVGVPGHGNPLLEADFDQAFSRVTDQLYLRYWMRFDESNWEGSDNPGGFAGKTAYITEVVDGVGSLYHSAGNAGNPSVHAISTNNGTRMNQAWATENWGGAAMWGSHAPAALSPDGQWHKVEYYADYATNRFMMAFDEIVVLFSEFPDGRVPIHPEWRMRGAQIFYVKSQHTILSTDISGIDDYACGWQLDDMEAWNGLPSDASNFRP